MAIPIRFAPVLEGDEAIEFYERWHQSLQEPLKSPISKEKREALKIHFLKHELDNIRNALKIEN